MRLGNAIWRAVPPGGKHETAPALDFVSAITEVGGLARVERKPWVIIGDLREELEAYFGLKTDGLIWEVSRWLAAALGSPSVVGLAHSSGNVYFGPEIILPSGSISPEQALIANLFSHGEMGVDLVAAHDLPQRESLGLLEEVATFKRMRWVDATQVAEASGASGGRTWREAGDKIGTARAGLLKRHPLIADAMGHKIEDAAIGKCLQHRNFGFLEISGNDMDEMQQSLARNSAARSYCPPGRDLHLGCAVRTTSGMLFAGFSIGVRSGDSGLSPLQSALVSLGANGRPVSDIHSVVWMAASGGDSDQAALLRRSDQELLQAIAPSASFAEILPEVE